MKLLKYSFILLLFVGMASCHKDEPAKTTETQTQPGFTPEVIVATTGDVLGYVYDDSGNPVSGATVRMLTETTTTNGYGVFKFRNTELDQQGTYLTVQKGGYILGSDMVYGVEGAKHTVRVQLMALTESGKFANGAGGTVSVDGGGQVVFAANSIENQDGTAYAGDVIVTAKRLASDDPFLSDLMPGGLLAIDEEGSTRALGTMGMVAVELRSPAGAELNLKPGTTAKVTFPIATNQQEAAPDIIDLWSFDESRGIWKEEGTATKVGNTYEADVSHFSFWNCDAPFPLVSICGKVVFEDGSPAGGVQIKITTNGFGTGFGWTNEDGSFNGKVPKGEVLTIKVYNSLCDGTDAIEIVEVGPFDNKTILDDIVISNPSEFLVEGLVVCSGTPIPNATIVYSFDGNTYITEAEADGSFVLGINDDCGELESLSLFVIDPNTGMATAPIVVSSGADPVLEFDVCDNSTGCDLVVTIEEDTSLDICLERGLVANAVGSNTYLYSWDNGETGSTINVTDQQGILCVTVTDATDPDCSQIVCSSFISSFSALQFTTIGNPACGGQLGSITANAFGGQAPYTFAVSPDLGPIDLTGDSTILDVPIGEYTLTVTDVNGCSVENTVTVEEFDDFTVNITQNSDCQGALLNANISGGTAPFQYIWSNGQSDGTDIWIWQDGTYCVTVIDANGCSQEECIDVFIDTQFDVVQLDIVDCSNGTYSVTNSNIGIDINLWYQNQEYIFDFSDTIEIDFAPYQFNNIGAVGFSPTFGCEFEVFIPLPAAIQGNGAVTYTSTDATCDTCADGSIVLNDSYLTYTEINGAMIGSAIVVDADYEDVTAEAAAGTLLPGIYYVAILDANTGCYIYTQTVQL